MNTGLGLRILGEIMDWTEDEATGEFRWLLFMSAYKYDNYRDFLAGYRFLESLANWLQQFNTVEERKIAYAFLRSDLIYFSTAEIHHLVEQFFPEYVQPDLIRAVSKITNRPAHLVWSSEESIKHYEIERRRTLFMGLSDGARIDTLRRKNAGTISNEQFVIATQIDTHKWRSLVVDLRKELKKSYGNAVGQDACFSRLYLIDDITASGTSLLRAPNGSEELEGKIDKFADSLAKAKDDLKEEGMRIFEDNFEVYVHHYIATEKAIDNIYSVYKMFKDKLSKRGLSNLKFTCGVSLPSNICITHNSTHPFRVLCDKYYDVALEGEEGEHAAQSGTKDKMYGYASCGTPIVLEHNTPNNSLPLLWADTESVSTKASCMRPLFRRRERHSDMDKSFNLVDETEVAGE